MDVTESYVKEKLANLPEKMLDWAMEVLLDQAHLMAGYASVGVPVDTGSLRDSIRVERGGEGMGWRQVRVRAGGYIVNPKSGKLVDYAVHVESRFPFMAPAFEMIKPQIEELLRTSIVEKANE
jgi:hypothetical protein